MAKFTKTTEIDISAMHEVVEEETPKKNRLGWIISIIVAIIIAFVVWLYVIETSNDLHEKTFNDVSVPGTEDTIDITVKGTYRALADLERDHFDISVAGDEYIVKIKSDAPENALTVTIISSEK